MNTAHATPGQPRVCAIHQPNFFPWLGYFDKIRRADVFVFMDDVAYPKSGSGTGSWVNRVKFLINGAPAWFGCPIRRESGVQLIRNVRIDDTQPWRRKLLRMLEVNYRKTRNYAEAMALFEPLVAFETDDLARFNMHAIRSICEYLGIVADFRVQSELATQAHSTDLLIEIAKTAGAGVYLCGDGAQDYQDDGKIEASGLKLVRQNFVPQPYGSPGDFVPGLSVIDYVMKR
jgi:hypothetical protein